LVLLRRRLLLPIERLRWSAKVRHEVDARITAPDIAKRLAELAARDGDDYLSDANLKRIFAALSALLACATEEGVIRFNPARDVSVPSGRDQLRRFDEDGDDEDDPQPGRAKALTESQLAAFLLVVDVRWRILFELLA
jgi:hypothetical protein